MTGGTDARSADETATDRTGSSARGVAVVWTLVIVAASLVDPAALLELVGASPTTGAGGTGGAGVFVAAHLAAYGVLAWVLVDGLGPNARDLRAVLATIIVAAAVGVGVELLQTLVAARTASVADGLVNAIGATVGAGLRAALDGR